MDFRIADTFTDSLARLTSDEQKAVKTTAFDLQLNPVNSGDELPQARQGEGQAVLVGARESGHPAHRPPYRRQPAALLRGPSRQGVRVGRATPAGDASRYGRGAARRDQGAGAGDRRPRVRASAADRRCAQATL